MQHAVTGSSVNQSHRSERLIAARQAIANGTVGERQFEEDEDSLAPELLWSGLGVAPATVKPSQVEAVLDNLVDKHSPLLAAQGSLQTFVGQASMDQLLMVVTTLMIKINNISGTFMLQSQKINAAASNQVMENQLQKQIEEAAKALEAQEKAKKSGIFGAIFNWITAVASVVWAAVTMNPVAMAGAVALLAAAVIETVQLAMGDDAPEWMGKVALGLTIAGSILSCGASLMTSAGKAALSAGSALVKTAGQQGVKAALKQLGQGILKEMSKALTKLVEWFKALPAQATETMDQIKNFGKSAVNKIKQPRATLKQAGQGIVKKTEKLVAPGNRLETVSGVAKGVAVGTTAVEGGVNTYYDYKGAMLQAEIKKLQNESWLLDTLLEYYQKQRKQLQQGMSDLYRQQGDATAIASDLLKESAGLQSRIAGSLA
ncbi:type III secretion system translocon subunit SctE [unidentified bacterial endosymbiont]|uniref:type III secretion system translocon subunit SctE n=1 Tax=unidentified bacterial endosymbiont TaxID=2355 RepID=UPI0020A05EAE|nr:type III secretion system translocon subunit SctE [unidentified bacterial endosymbiont]